MIETDNTTKLMDELSSSRQLSGYLNRHPLEQTSCLSFADYLNHLIQKKQLKKSILIRRINMNRSYAYEIFCGRKHPSREKTISLAFGLRLSLQDTQRLLNRAGYNPLYPKNRRDVVLIYAKINRFTTAQTNLLLYDHGEDLLE